jgi:predicted transglutaminase-like cysteine proteinase
MRLFVSIAAVALMLTPAVAEEPFDIAPMPTKDEAVIVIWRDLQFDMAADQAQIAKCGVAPNCDSPGAKRFLSIVDKARHHQGRALIGHLNRAINAAIPVAAGDVPLYAPLSALTYPGDCKSYVVVKYVALAYAGIVAADRRIVWVWDHRRPNTTHVVVVVREGEHWLILDNLTLALVDWTAAHPYQPLYVFDESGVREFPSQRRGER